jgi:hypothetical protein
MLQPVTIGPTAPHNAAGSIVFFKAHLLQNNAVGPFYNVESNSTINRPASTTYTDCVCGCRVGRKFAARGLLKLYVAIQVKDIRATRYVIKIDVTGAAGSKICPFAGV